MAMTGRVSIIVNLKDVRSSDFENASSEVNFGAQWDVTAGTGLGQMNLFFQDQRVLTTGASEGIDVAGALTNQFGTTVFTAVKVIAVSSDPANTTNLTVGRQSNSLPFLSVTPATVLLTPGDMFLLTNKLAAGIAVTGGSADVITITNAAGASATYNIVVGGLS